MEIPHLESGLTACLCEEGSSQRLDPGLSVCARLAQQMSRALGASKEKEMVLNLHGPLAYKRHHADELCQYLP